MNGIHFCQVFSVEPFLRQLMKGKLYSFVNCNNALHSAMYVYSPKMLDWRMIQTKNSCK